MTKISVLFLCIIFLSGCSTATQMVTSVGVESGVITPEQKRALDTTAVQAEKAARPITETEEYYIGRGVAARILSQYAVYEQPDAMRYINYVGRTLAMNSSRPYTYGGYHFAVLDTGEINAFACPGGMIFVTRGMLDIVQSEDQLAAVLAHEIGHINAKHGLKAISRARWTQVATALGLEAAKVYSGAQLTNLVELFQGTVDDVFKAIVVNGYGREDEFAADELAENIMGDSGYDPRALADVLANLEGVKGNVKGGIFATHPDMAVRLQSAGVLSSTFSASPAPPERIERFSQISVVWMEGASALPFTLSKVVSQREDQGEVLRQWYCLSRLAR
jgi:predicted Zn-dependent protease